jgi:hypothetical protein
MNAVYEIVGGLFVAYLVINVGGGLLYDRYCGDGSINRKPRERVEPHFYERIEPK